MEIRQTGTGHRKAQTLLTLSELFVLFVPCVAELQ